MPWNRGPKSWKVPVETVAYEVAEDVGLSHWRRVNLKDLNLNLNLNSFLVT